MTDHKMSQFMKQMSVHFELTSTPYTSVVNIGTGAYGVVCKAIHQPSQRYVAIKKISGAFANQTLVKRTLRELRILRNFHHENIIAVSDMFRAANSANNVDIYLVMDLMETDLHQIIYSQQPLTDQHHQYFLYQILRGLKYIHSAGVVHRDLKPSNLLINADCLLKIGDFGMARACGAKSVSDGAMTQYVATRWYRAPELLCSIVDYTTQVDIWSVACILAEMINRRQLFAGNNARDQITLIVRCLGSPDQQFMSASTSDLVRQWIGECGAIGGAEMKSIVPKAQSPAAVDLLSKMLVINPWRRFDVNMALEHEYLAIYHDVQFEPACAQQVIVETDRIEHLNLHQIKCELQAEVGTYQKAAVQHSGIDDQTKHALKQALARRQLDQLQSTSVIPESTIAHPKITAHERRMQREEKRRKKTEKDIQKEREAFEASLSEDNQRQLARWQQMQQQHGQQNAIEDDIIDAITATTAIIE